MLYCILKTIMYTISIEKFFLSKIKPASKVKVTVWFTENVTELRVWEYMPHFSNVVSDKAHVCVSSGRKSGWACGDRAGHSRQWVLQSRQQLEKHDFGSDFLLQKIETRDPLDRCLPALLLMVPKEGKIFHLWRNRTISGIYKNV